MKVKVLNAVGFDGAQYNQGDVVDISKEDFDLIVDLDTQAGRAVRVEKITRRKKDAENEDQ